jgi:hypothetical protein
MQEKDEIEESIIEEDIQPAHGQGSPGTPLINSRTKGKGRDLRLMKPPKPINKEVSNHTNKHSPMNGKVFAGLGNNNIRANIDGSLTEIPERSSGMGMNAQSKNISMQQDEETFDEFYPLPSNKVLVDDQKRPFSPPIKKHNYTGREEDKNSQKPHQ